MTPICTARFASALLVPSATRHERSCACWSLTSSGKNRSRFRRSGLLAPLAAGEFSPKMRAVLPMTDALRGELSQLLREREEISSAARRLQESADAAGDRESEELAQALLSHARAEEAVFYPAAILVVDFVRLRDQALEPQPTPQSPPRYALASG
jgi:hypothetical protein